MPAANVTRLLALLSEKFPGLRLRLDEASAPRRHFWPTGLASIDGTLGGLPRGGLTEIVGGENSAGSATLLRALLSRAATENQIVAWIDAGDSLDVAGLDPGALARLLWVRCRSVPEAMKSADLILRDANLTLMVFDLKLAAPAELRRVPPTAWYRFQRLVERTGAICAVCTPWPMVNPAEARIRPGPPFSIGALERDTADLLRDLTLEISNLRADSAGDLLLASA